MIQMIMCDGSNDAGLVAINWADKDEHLVPRINAEYAYRPPNGKSYPFGKDIFKAICPSKINAPSVKEDYCIKNSDLTLIFGSEKSRDIKSNIAIYNQCIFLNIEVIFVDLHTCNITDIGMIVELLDKLDIKILNITGSQNLNPYEQKVLVEILTLMYKMLKKESIDYLQYEIIER